MAINNKNQAQANNQLNNSVKHNWQIQLSPISVTLIPSEQTYSVTDVYQTLEQELQKTKHALTKSNIFQTDLMKNISNKLDISCKTILSELLTLYGVETNRNNKNVLSNKAIDCTKELLNYSSNLANLLQKDTKLVTLDLQAFDLEQLVEDTVDKLQQKAKAKNLDLFCNFQYNLAKIIIADSYWISATLEQLVINAIKFTKEGKVIVTVNLFPITIVDDNNKRILQFIIHDTGIGMPAEIQQYIKGHHTESDATTWYTGLYSGLTLVKRLIHEMHGEIQVESEKNISTTVTCNIPVKLPISNNQLIIKSCRDIFTILYFNIYKKYGHSHNGSSHAVKIS
ncbi:sensor histidine kinase [Rickettsia amblyommatis]|uniref:sensor histidine kinase n=1 Tax=Rickettsia amblyommatis TaxID=33989 RepID=UPI0008707B6D|nr:HAMP domain-containing sensor histidine kinase [Rickettsia amblyommatis]